MSVYPIFNFFGGYFSEGLGCLGCTAKGKGYLAYKCLTEYSKKVDTQKVVTGLKFVI